MPEKSVPELIFLFTAVLLVLGGVNFRELALKIAELISNFPNGPGSGSHPLPADDSRILLRKRRRQDSA